MSDTTTVWDVANNRGDWQLQGAMLETGSDLATSVLNSFFSDRAAQPGDVIPDGSSDPRGWPCEDDAEFPLGSRMWLLSRAKQTQKVLQDAQAYLAESVQWLIADGVVARFDITTVWAAPGRLAATAIAYKPDGTSQPLGTYSWVWKQIN